MNSIRQSLLRPVIWLVITLGAIAGCVAPAAPRVNATAAGTAVEVVMFPLASAAPVYVAADRGFYAREGLDVTLTRTPDSAHLVAGLADGRYQFAAALVDNFVAYAAGQHAVPRRPRSRLAIAMGLSTTSVALVARPDVADVASLRGRRVGVDAPGTGFALVLYRLLESSGMSGADVTLVRSGSTATRLQALLDGELEATVLSPEYAARAVDQGLNVLEDSRTVLGTYMGVGIGVDRGWAERNPDVLRGFLRATRAAAAWLLAPANRALAADILARRLDIPEPDARAELERLIRDNELIPDGRVDRDGMETVLELRARFGRPQAAIEAADAYLLQSADAP